MNTPIHEAARDLGISTATLRRWERMGLLPFRPQRNAVGRRVFTSAEIEVLRSLLHARHPETRDSHT